MTALLLAVEKPQQALRRPAGGHRRQPDRHARRDLQRDRPQRRRQDHAVQHDQRRAAAQRGADPVRRPGHRAADVVGLRPPRHRPHVPEPGAVQARHRGREHPDRPPHPSAAPPCSSPWSSSAAPGARRSTPASGSSRSSNSSRSSTSATPCRHAVLRPAEARRTGARARLRAEAAAARRDGVRHEPEETEDIARFVLDIRDELGITVLMIEHEMQIVMDLSDRVHVLNFGRKIAEGTPAEVRRDPAVRKPIRRPPAGAGGRTMSSEPRTALRFGGDGHAAGTAVALRRAHGSAREPGAPCARRIHGIWRAVPGPLLRDARARRARPAVARAQARRPRRHRRRGHAGMVLRRSRRPDDRRQVGRHLSDQSLGRAAVHRPATPARASSSPATRSRPTRCWTRWPTMTACPRSRPSSAST